MKKSRIENFALFNQIRENISISDEKLNHLYEYFAPKKIKKKEYLLRAGSVSKHEYFILVGCLRAFVVSNNGTEHNIMFGTENWWLGDYSSFLMREPASYNIQALENTEILQISREKWDDLFLKIPEAENYFRVMFQNAVIGQQSRIVQNISFTAEERYLDFLRKFPKLPQRISQKHIASYLGVTPEFLSKLRKKRSHI